MKTVGLFEAKTHFSKLAEEVHAGETITVTKHGVPFLELRPLVQAAAMTVDEAVEGLLAIRARSSVSGPSILEMIEMGRA